MAEFNVTLLSENSTTADNLLPKTSMTNIKEVAINSSADNKSFLKYNGSLWVNSHINYLTDIDNKPAVTDQAIPGSTALITSGGVVNAIEQSATKTLKFEGVINSPSDLPSSPKIGMTYAIGAAGTYAGHVCEVGDIIICEGDSPVKWGVIQANLNGAVTGPTSATVNNVAIFNSTTGKVIKDSGFTIEKSVPADAVFTDTHYTSLLVAGGVGDTTNNARSNGDVNINNVENGVVTSSNRIYGTNNMRVESTDAGDIKVVPPTFGTDDKNTISITYNNSQHKYIIATTASQPADYVPIEDMPADKRDIVFVDNRVSPPEALIPYIDNLYKIGDCSSVKNAINDTVLYYNGSEWIAHDVPKATDTKPGGIKVLETILSIEDYYKVPQYDNAIYYTDRRVKQRYNGSVDDKYPILFSEIAGVTSGASRGNVGSYVDNKLYYNPYEGTLYAKELKTLDGREFTTKDYVDTEITNLRSYTDSEITDLRNYTDTELFKKADKTNITAGTAGTSSATSGTNTISIPYVTMNTDGVVTAYGTHTHTIGTATDSALGVVKVDTAISSTSTNPVQNKVIKTELDKKLDIQNSNYGNTDRGYKFLNIDKATSLCHSIITTSGWANNIYTLKTSATSGEENLITKAVIGEYGSKQDLTYLYIAGEGQGYSNPSIKIVPDSGNITTIGDVVAGDVSLKNHTHDDDYVPITRKVNGHALSADIAVTSQDIFNGQKIALGTTYNLNDVQTPGVYYQTQNANATTARNYPEAKAGALLVMAAAGVVQVYFAYNSSRIWMRGFYNSSWSAWTRMVLPGDTFVKSGSSAATGLVPKPSTTAGTTKFLCEDATWKVAGSTITMNASGTATAIATASVTGKIKIDSKVHYNYAVYA